MTDNRVFALTAALFFVVLAWGLITFGGNGTKMFAFMSLAAGGMGQFLAQAEHYYARWAAVLFNYLGIIFMLIALISYWT